LAELETRTGQILDRRPESHSPHIH
jgi:hypothetical protein